jgi:hypothetical protein
MAETFKKQRYTASGWSTTFSRNLIDREAVSISAWAFDIAVQRKIRTSL